MTYCTKADLEQRYGTKEVTDLLDRDANNTEDTGAFNAAAADAAAMIDGYLAGRYNTPLTVVPELIKSIACEITRYKLWDDRAPEEVRRRYEDALRTLREIPAGLVSLPTTLPSASDLDGIGYEANERYFTFDSLKGF